jgi:hypothetical protein
VSNELRMALNRNRPIGNQCSYDQSEAATAQRRELKKRGHPRDDKDDESLPAGRVGGVAALISGDLGELGALA